MEIRGDLEAGDYVKFRAHLNGERRIVGLVLHSPGGLLYEGFQIGMLTHQRRLSTFVAQECDSACAFIFLLGRKRYVSRQAKIGVHAVGNDYGGEDRGTFRDTIHFARLFMKLGIPNGTIGKMVTTPPGKIAFLDQNDLAALKVVERDPFVRKGDGGGRPCYLVAAGEASAKDSDRKSSRRPASSRSSGRESLARAVDEPESR